MKIFRYEVPVDGEWHTFDLRGLVLFVACRKHGVVEFWASHAGDEVEDAGDEYEEWLGFGERTFKAIGTGHEFDSTNIYHGSALDGPYVWHLIERV